MRLLKACVLFLCLLCFAATAVYAQTTAGSMSGTVTDPNGAVVPGSKVLATHDSTKRDFSTVTTDSGIYVFGSLPVGLYTVTVTQPGFKKSVQTGVEILLNTRQTLDFKMAVGDVQESVEVKAELPLLETTTAMRGENVTPQFVMSLPVFSGGIRSAEAFVGYMPGVNSNGEMSVNGSNGRAREVMIDGASLTIAESGGTVFYFPGFEAYSEMNLVTSSFNAEYGRLGGGLETFATKSGTNQLHLAAFLNLRRDVLDAAGWASNAVVGRPTGYRAKERYNEEGGTAGGPVYIPHVYDGRNRTFFYFTWDEDVRPAAITPNLGETIPTLKARTGDFSEFATIYDPNTTQTVNGLAVRTPFANNIIPQARWSAISSKFLSAIPTPTNGNVTSNFDYISTSALTDRVVTWKIDHQITANNRIAYFETYRNQLSASDQYLPGPLSNGLLSYQKPDMYRINHDWIARPTFLVHTTFGFTRDRNIWNNPLQNGFGSKVGLPLSGNSDATPIVNFQTDSLQAWGMNQGKVNNGRQDNWTTMMAQQMTWIRGKHELKMGWDIRRLRTSGNDLAGTNGTYNFSRYQTAGSVATQATTGNAFASFLLGDAISGSKGDSNYTPGSIRYGYHAGFWQDTWRITPRFTLDYGVRYEVPIGWHAIDGNYSSWSPTTPNAAAGGLPGALIFAGSGAGRTGQKRLYPTDFSDIGPRGGFAWHPLEKTVIRGGYGIYYQTLGNGGCGCTDGINGSYSQTGDNFSPAFNWDQGGVLPPPGYKSPPRIDPTFDNFNSGIYQMGPNYGRAPRIYSWSFTIQQEYKNWLFETAYVGNRGHGLNSGIYSNTLPTSYLSLGSLLTKNILDPAVVAAGYKEPFTGFAKGWGAAATLAQSLRPYPQVGTVYDANSGVGRLWYDSLQSKIERRFGALTLMGSWVWSKNLGLMTYRQIFSQGSNVQAQDAYNINTAKSFSFMDFPNFVNILTSYNMPFGKGKRYLASSGQAMNMLVGGWTISGTQQYRSGGLIQAYTQGNPLNAYTYTPVTYANLTGVPIRTGVSSTDLDPNSTARFFNSGANAPYVSAPQLTLGTASLYNTNFRNPWFRQENISIVKDIFFHESIKFQYRADAFNIFNRTSFGNVNGTIGNVNFGRIQSPVNGARVITMGLRAEF